MKLGEILKVPGQAPIPVGQFVNKQLVTANYQGAGDVYIYDDPVNSAIKMYTLEKDGSILTVLVGTPAQGSSAQSFWVSRSYTPQGSRGQGYSKALYYFVHIVQGYILVSDQEMSDGSVAVWNSLSKAVGKPLKVLDMTAGSVQDISNYTNQQLYGDINLRFILESLGPDKNFRKGVLSENIIHVHPDYEDKEDIDI